MTEPDIVAEILKQVADTLVKEGRDEDPQHAVATAIVTTLQVFMQENLLNEDGIKHVQDVLNIYGQVH